jgi:hypothetical protein
MMYYKSYRHLLRSTLAAASLAGGAPLALGQAPATQPPAAPQAQPAVQPEAVVVQPETFLAGSATNNPMANEMTPELDRAVTRGLAALARSQNADGSWGEAQFGRTVAVTSLACLAFMADGNLPGRGVYGDNVSKGLEYILQNSAENGLVATPNANSPMYGHGFAALFLGEIYGTTMGGADTQLADRTHEALVRATRLISQTQNSEGGWRYNPIPFDADVSVTICQIMALRSARNAGLLLWALLRGAGGVSCGRSDVGALVAGDPARADHDADAGGLVAGCERGRGLWDGDVFDHPANAQAVSADLSEVRLALWVVVWAVVFAVV